MSGPCTVCGKEEPGVLGVCGACLDAARRRETTAWAFRTVLSMMLLAPAIPWSLPEIRDIFAGPPRLLEAWIFGTAGLTAYAAHRWLGWLHAAPAVVAGRAKCNPPGAVTE